jgi:hypothetical protein
MTWVVISRIHHGARPVTRCTGVDMSHEVQGMLQGEGDA